RFCFKPIRQSVREASRLYLVVWSQVGRRHSYSEIARAVLTRCYVAYKRQKRLDLSARVSEVNAVQPYPALLHSELSHGIQIVAPVPATDDEAGKAFPGEKSAGCPGLQKRADVHVRCQPPRRGADEN